MTNTTDTTTEARPHTEAEWADMQAQIEAARMAECDVAGCDRRGHIDVDYPEDWIHTFAEGSTGPLGYQLYVLDGTARMLLLERDAREDMTADDVRTLAAELEGAPARLRALADELDRRNS
jgi:hypothetical protein